jgi:hypothetical protein
MMATPKEMRIEISFDDGSRKQVRYDLSPYGAVTTRTRRVS